MKIVERAIRLDEFDETLRVLFDEILFQPHQIERCEFLGVVLAGLQQGLDGIQRRPRKRSGGFGQPGDERLERQRIEHIQLVERGQQFILLRQRHGNARRLRVAGNERMQVVQIFR